MESPPLYTQELIVFTKGVQSADIAQPITVYTDTAGNHAVSDGNHRSFKAAQEGRLNELQRDVIGHFERDISQDTNYRPITELRLIDKDPA